MTKGKGFTKEKNKKKRGTSIATKKKPRKSAAELDWEKDYLDAFSLSPSPHPGDFGDMFDDNPLGFKEGTWAFMSGVGFNPMGGGRWL